MRASPVKRMWFDAGGRTIGARGMPASVKWFISFLMLMYIYLILAEPPGAAKPRRSRSKAAAPAATTIIVLRARPQAPDVGGRGEPAAGSGAWQNPAGAGLCPSCEERRRLTRRLEEDAERTRRRMEPPRQSSLSELVDSLEEAIDEHLGRSSPP
jgi:hypothetical protein